MIIKVVDLDKDLSQMLWQMIMNKAAEVYGRALVDRSEFEQMISTTNLIEELRKKVMEYYSFLGTVAVEAQDMDWYSLIENHYS